MHKNLVPKLKKMPCGGKLRKQGIFSKNKIMKIKELIKKLEKLPKDYKVMINVDNVYSAYIKSVYIDQYEKNNGRNIVTIKVR